MPLLYLCSCLCIVFSTIRAIQESCQARKSGSRPAARPGRVAGSRSTRYFPINWQEEEIADILFAPNTIIEIIQKESQRDTNGQRDDHQQRQQRQFTGGRAGYG